MTDNERKEILLKAKPILFNTEMVRAILDGRKTVTRRVLKNQDSRAFDYDCNYDTDGVARSVDLICDNGNNGLWAVTNKIPYFENDILYARETWGTYSICEGIMPTIYYKADGNAPDKIKWKPSIHMPKEAARIFLRVTNVRVERLQDCGNMQAKDEGCNCCSQFARIWDSTIKKSDLAKYGWEANPWVWVIEFERID